MLVTGTISPLNSPRQGPSCSPRTIFVLSTGSMCSWGKQKLPHLTTTSLLPTYPLAKQTGVPLLTIHRDFPAGEIWSEEGCSSPARAGVRCCHSASPQAAVAEGGQQGWSKGWPERSAAFVTLICHYSALGKVFLSGILRLVFLLG